MLLELTSRTMHFFEKKISSMKFVEEIPSKSEMKKLQSLNDSIGKENDGNQIINWARNC
jgi:hypothetical protein